LEGSRAPREELGRAKLVLPHAIWFGTLEGSRAPREGLGRAKLVLPHAIWFGTLEGSRAPRSRDLVSFDPAGAPGELLAQDAEESTGRLIEAQRAIGAADVDPVLRRELLGPLAVDGQRHRSAGGVADREPRVGT